MRLRTGTGMRTDVYDATCSTVTGSIAQCRLGQSNQMERCHDINLVKLVPHRRTGSGKVAVRNDSANTGVIDQYVELPPRGDSSLTSLTLSASTARSACK